VRDGNPAVRLYKRAGFSQVGRRRNYYSGRDGQLFDLVRLALPPELVDRVRSIRHYNGQPIPAAAVVQPLLEQEAVPA